MEDTRNLHPQEKVLEVAMKKKQKNHKMFHWGTIDLGSFEVLPDHGDTMEDEVDVDESSEETTRMMPPLPPASWFKKTVKHTEMHCGKFRKSCNGDHRDEESPFFDCWDWKHEQSDLLQRVDPWAQNAPKSVPNVKGCLSVTFPVCSVCQKLGGVPTSAT